MKVGMTIEPFQTEWVHDFGNGGGNVVVSFFGTQIYATDNLSGEPMEHVLDRITEVAMAEFGNLLAERLDKRITIKPEEAYSWEELHVE